MDGPLSETATQPSTERAGGGQAILFVPQASVGMVGWMDGGIELDYFDGCDDCHAGAAASRFPRRV